MLCEIAGRVEWECLLVFAVEFRCSGIVAIFDYHAVHCILYSLVVITYGCNAFNF